MREKKEFRFRKNKFCSLMQILTLSVDTVTDTEFWSCPNWHTQIFPLIKAKTSTLNFFLYYYCPPIFFDLPPCLPGSYYWAQNHPLLFLAQLVRMFWFSLVKFIYSEKATKFCEIFTLLLPMLKISQTFVFFSTLYTTWNILQIDICSLKQVVKNIWFGLD